MKNQNLMEFQLYRTGRQRLWAAVIDCILFLPLLLVVSYTSDPTFQTIIGWLHNVTPVIYSVFCHCRYGQTVGKWVTGVKVLDISEQRNLNLRQALTRDVVPILAILIEVGRRINGLTESFGFDTVELIIFCWPIVEIVTMFSNVKRRAIHDFISGSIVVRDVSNREAQTQ